MGNEALIIAAYLPNMVSCLLAAMLYLHWRRKINNSSDVNGPTKDLLNGIFFIFLGQFVSATWALVARSFELDWFERFFPSKALGLAMFNFVPVILMVNIMIFIGAALHLHAYWNARYGRSFVKVWVMLAALWYVFVAWLFY